MLADWHDKHYAPQNTILAISGDVHAETLVPKLRQMAGGVAAIESVRKFSPGLRRLRAKRKYF